MPTSPMLDYMDCTGVAQLDNTVFLRGTLGAPAECRTLADGAEAWAFKVAVRRRGASGTRVDVIDCSARTAATSRTVQRWAAGDSVEITGALHRRFWRSAVGLASRYEVEVSSARRTTTRRARSC